MTDAQADEREAIARTLYETHNNGFNWAREMQEEKQTFYKMADAILALPPCREALAREGEPFAWVVLSDQTGDTRMWTRNGDIAKAFADKHLLECIALYRALPPTTGAALALASDLDRSGAPSKAK